MGRPPASELTGRELEVMHIIWALGSATVAEVRDELARGKLDLAYTTVATLVRILADKGFVEQINEDRPFRYRPARTYEEVSGRMLEEVVDRVFRGSREQLLVRLMEERRLSAEERALLEQVLRDGEEAP